MKKYFLIVTAVLFFMNLAFPAYAHSVLDSSDPQQGQVVTEPLSQITLTFDTKVEMGSRLEVIKQNGDKVKPDDIKLEGNQMIGAFSKPLENGDYTIKWEIVGADGHPVKGEISFEIDLTQYQPERSQEERENEKTANAKQTNQGKKKNQTESAAANQSLSPLLTGFIVALVFVAVFAVSRFLRRKK